MTILAQVNETLGDRDDWKAEVARTLASALDSEPNASLARELRATMTMIENGETDDDSGVADELKARRQARIAASADR